jgi:WD40 repeat protein
MEDPNYVHGIGYTYRFSSDDAFVLFSTRRMLLKFDMKHRSNRLIFNAPNCIWDIAISPDNRFVALAITDCNVEIRSIETGDLVHDIGVRSFSVSYSPDGTLLATTYHSRTLIWSTQKGDEIAQINNPLSSNALFSPCGKFILHGNVAHSLQSGEDQEILSVNALSPDGQYFIAS